MRPGRDAWILGLMLLMFVVGTSYYSGRHFEQQQNRQPTTYNVGQAGLKALYQLCRAQGLPVQRFERSFEDLPVGARVLVVSEPFETPVEKDDLAALRHWVEKGGFLVVILSANGNRLDRAGFPLAGLIDSNSTQSADLALGPDKEIPGDSDAARALCRDVATVHVGAGPRFSAKEDTYESLIPAADGDVLGRRVYGSGQVIIASSALGFANGDIARGDNAVLAMNLMEAGGAGRTDVLFDEYHQGYGVASGGHSVWRAVGAPVRATVWYLLALFAVYVYSANRRFGTARRLLPPSYRPSTEYITSMASLYRRARRPEIAVESMYRAFCLDMAQRLDLSPDPTPERLVEAMGIRFGIPQGAAGQMMKRCGEIVAGASATETELLQIAQQMQQYRRRADLDRVSN